MPSLIPTSYGGGGVGCVGGVGGVGGGGGDGSASWRWYVAYITVVTVSCSMLRCLCTPYLIHTAGRRLATHTVTKP